MSDPAIDEMTEQDFQDLKSDSEEFTEAERECLQAIENGNCARDCTACPIYAKMDKP